MGRHEGMQSFLGRRSSLSCSSMVASISWSPTLDKCLVQDTAPATPALEMKPVTPNADALPCNTSGRLRLPHELRLSLDTPGSHKCWALRSSGGRFAYRHSRRLRIGLARRLVFRLGRATKPARRGFQKDG